MIDSADAKERSDGTMDMDSPTILGYAVRVTIRQISPLIWRRVLVRRDSTITDLHSTLQLAFGWSDLHLHRFHIHGKDYGIAYEGGMAFADDPDQIQLASFHFRPHERFLYEYDFGDCWQHDVHVEREVPLLPPRSYPVCTAGARATPPEDCGGALRFMALRQHFSPFTIAERVLELLAEAEGDPDAWIDSAAERHELADWLNVDRFDRRAVNRRLHQYATGDEDWQWEAL